MRFTGRPRPPLLAAAPAASLLAVCGFTTLLTVVLAAADLLDRGPRRPVETPAPASKPAGGSVPGSEPAADVDADLETLVVEVRAKGESVRYHVGAREAGSAEALAQLLRPLARFGGAISVRISHDAPFARTAAAVAACRDAGFRTVLLVPGGPSPPR
jgi:biopolymer transport protein ExbD